MMEKLNCSLLLTSIASSAIIAYHDGLGDFTLWSIHPSTSRPIMFISSLTMSRDMYFLLIQLRLNGIAVLRR